MTTKHYIYLGSTKENHQRLMVIARSLGVWNVRKMTTGELIAAEANKGNERFVAVCEANGEFFAAE